MLSLFNILEYHHLPIKWLNSLQDVHVVAYWISLSDMTIGHWQSRRVTIPLSRPHLVPSDLQPYPWDGQMQSRFSMTMLLLSSEKRPRLTPNHTSMMCQSKDQKLGTYSLMV